MKRQRLALGAVVCLLAGLVVREAAASPQSTPDPGSPSGRPRVVTRTEDGKVTVRAFRVSSPLEVDGRLDEEIYATVDPRAGFIEQEPRFGVPAAEQTDIWILFDDQNLYISARCWDSHPELGVVNELRRDGDTMNFGENLAVALDTFHDQRNGFFFQTNPLGAVRDQAVVSEIQNDDWNTVWNVDARWFDRGWTMEMAIPFKSLRYLGSGAQVWGINFRRVVKWKNEQSLLTEIPRHFGLNGIFRLALAATLVGLETPARSMNLELKPYWVSSSTTDRAAVVPFENDFIANGGVDFKYGLTRSLIADATYNTDFAQVEEDVQQVNLTRFSLFFPEKRDFFLEGQGIFSFGGVVFNNRSTPGDVPVLFFSRRIGLSQGQSVPVVAGARVTGKASRFHIGALNIQTDDKPEAGAVSTNFTVARVKMDFMRRSNIGLLATRRAPSTFTGDTNLAGGADLSFLPSDTVSVFAYYARTDTPGVTDGQTSYRSRFEYNTDRYGGVAEHMLVGDRFNPEVGFVRRTDFRRSIGQLRFSPRPKQSELIRKFIMQGTIEYFTNAARTEVQNRTATGVFTIQFQNSDQVSVEHVHDYELLPGDFEIDPGVIVPAGGYDNQTTRVSYTLGRQRKISGEVSAATGSFYDGTKTETVYTGRVVPFSRFALEPSISLNWVDLPYGEFTATQINCRFILSPTPRMLVSSLMQYSAGADTLSSSVRLGWEYTPGSELFVVYSDGRTTAVRGVPDILNRSLALKITRLVRF